MPPAAVLCPLPILQQGSMQWENLILGKNHLLLHIGGGGSLFLPVLTLRSGSNGLPAWGTASGDEAVWGTGWWTSAFFISKPSFTSTGGGKNNKTLVTVFNLCYENL